MEISLPMLPSGISLNSRVHWAKRKAATDAAHQQIALYAPSLDRPISRCSLVIRFYLPSRRRRDIDNLIGAAKGWIDGLVALGVLEGDDTGCIASLYADTAYRRGNPGTRIILTEMTL